MYGGLGLRQVSGNEIVKLVTVEDPCPSTHQLS